MIVPDVNLLVYAYNDGAPRYQLARNRWEELLDGDETIGLPWVVATGFIRLMANPGFVISPLSPAAAADHVIEWFQYSNVVPLEPGDQHLVYFRQCLSVSGSGPNLVPDAHIAALAIEYDAEVHSADSDFARFPGVRWRNPLA